MRVPFLVWVFCCMWQSDHPHITNLRKQLKVLFAGQVNLSCANFDLLHWWFTAQEHWTFPHSNSLKQVAATSFTACTCNIHIITFKLCCSQLLLLLLPVFDRLVVTTVKFWEGTFASTWTCSSFVWKHNWLIYKSKASWAPSDGGLRYCSWTLSNVRQVKPN